LTGTDSGATATSGTITSADSIPYTGRNRFFRKGETITGSTSDAVGTIANAGTTEVINYIRGADVYDEDGDSNTSENRAIICGDPLHSEPAVVSYGDIDGDSATPDKVMVFFGANDGMLHAVNDEDGTEAWSFVPPDLLPELKKIIEESEHQYYVDSSPAVLIKDYNGNGIVDQIPTLVDGISYQDTVYLVCGERNGGTSYFALDVTVPTEPKFLWRIAQTAGTPVILRWMSRFRQNRSFCGELPRLPGRPLQPLRLLNSGKPGPPLDLVLLKHQIQTRTREQMLFSLEVDIVKPTQAEDVFLQ